MPRTWFPRFVSMVMVTILLAMSLAPGAVSDSLATADSTAVAYQIDPGHGGATSPSLPLPLVTRWSVDLGSAISYPLIAQGMVYVTVKNAAGSGTRLYALDAQTGSAVWGPVLLDGTYYWSNAAYDNGRVFVVNYNGLLRAFDAVSGAQLWSNQLPGQYAFSSPPSASSDVVYVGGAGSGGTLYAVNAVTGALIWSQPVANGDHSAPALSGDAVFVSYPGQVYGFNRLTGAPLWHVNNGISGGGGKTSVYAASRLLVRDPVGGTQGIYDATTGARLGGLTASAAPAVLGNTAFVRNGATLQAVAVPSGAVLWSFAGDGSLSSAPIVVGGEVYIGSATGNLYAVDTATGAQRWSTNVGASIPAPDEQNVSQPLTGLNAGGGLLVVPAGNRLVAFAPAPPTLTSTATSTATSTPTLTATATDTPQPTATATMSVCSTPKNKRTPTPTGCVTPTPRRR